MFTHDSLKGTDGYSTTAQYKCSAVSILVRSEALAKCPISDCVYKQEMFKSRFFINSYKLEREKSTLMTTIKDLVVSQLNLFF